MIRGAKLSIIHETTKLFSKKTSFIPTFCYNYPISRHFFLIFKRKRRQFYKNCRPFQILVFHLQFLTENKEHIERNIEHLGILIFRRSFRQILIFRRSLKKVSFIEESFSGKVSSIKEISYGFSSFIKENVVSLHPD